MSTLMHPVGPASPGVYWRRRAAITILLLLLVAGAYSVVGALSSAAGGGDVGHRPPVGDTETPPAGDGTSTDMSTSSDLGTSTASSNSTDLSTSTADPSAAASTADATAAADPGAATAAACEPESVAVLVSTDDARYSPDAVPVITLTVRNESEAPCDVDVGSAGVELVVTSGSDRVWSSDDCEQQGGSRVVSLDPGAEDSTTVQWRRERSAPGCSDDLPDPLPGTYVVAGSLGDLTSDGVSFVLD